MSARDDEGLRSQATQLAEAIERGQNLIGSSWHVARRIDILDAHEPAPASGTRIQIAACRRNQRPEME